MNKNIIKHYTDSNIPFVAYKLPCEENFYLANLTDEKPFIFDFLDKPPSDNGFVVFPFDNRETNGWWFNKKNIKQFNIEKVDKFSDENVKYKNYTSQSTFEIYKEQFFQMKKELLSENVKKVVLSRIINIPFVDINRLYQFFPKLCNNNPDAFVYILSTPQTGIWAGASPELLINKESNNYTLISLAGTKQNRETEIENWTAKEFDEQGIVSDFIDKQLKTFKVDNYKKIGPNVMPANSVIHLKTEYRFNTNVLAGKVGKFVQALHPTPAISGEPKLNAMDIIRKTEQHKRKFYGGFIGIVSESKINLFVNIRCVNFENEIGNIYVGGGLTKSSIAEQEWQETEMKSQTILQSL